MAKEEIKIKTELRQEQGSGAARRLRRTGVVPAVVNRIAGGCTMLKLNTRDFENMLRHHMSNQLLVTLDIDGQPVSALLREVQTDGRTRRCPQRRRHSGADAAHGGGGMPAGGHRRILHH